MRRIENKSVIVVGSGIVGACCAYYLRKAGWEVKVVDQGYFGNACSHGNCGLISPSHVLPLAMPGVIQRTLPMVFSESAPFRIKPTFNPKLWAWLLRFAMRCRKQPMLESARGRHSLLQSSVQLYEQLFDDENIDCEWQQLGCLLVFKSNAGMDRYSKVNRFLSDYGLAARRYDADEVCLLEPALQRGLAGGWYHEMDAHLRPDKLMTELRRVLCENDVQILEKTKVIGFVRHSERAIAIKTNQGEVAADHFVIATGSWTPFLNKCLGMRIPIQPGKGYSMTMSPPTVSPRIPLVLQERKVVVTPMRSCYRLGSTMEFSGYDETLKPARIQALRNGAAEYLLQPFCDPIEEEWYGWRPMTYDGKPIIDRSHTYRNVHIAAGHNMLGLSMGAATGKLITELVSGSQPHIDPKPYTAGRF